MRAFYTDPLGFTANLFKHMYKDSTHLVVHSPEGHCLHTNWYASWDEAIAALKFMLPNCVNDLTHEPIT